MDISRLCFALVNKTAPARKNHERETDLVEIQRACGTKMNVGTKAFAAATEMKTSMNRTCDVDSVERSMTVGMIVKNAAGD
jgi:hypothetical protein